MHIYKAGLVGLLLVVYSTSWAQNIRISTFEQKTAQVDTAIKQ